MMDAPTLKTASLRSHFDSSASAKPPHRPAGLAHGASGPEVAVLKQALNDRGFKAGTGEKFDGQMHRAVRAFQRSQGFQITGNVGPKTWAALSAVLEQQDDNVLPRSSDGFSAAPDVTPAPTDGAPVTISPEGREQMERLLAYSKRHNAGASKGHCYHYVLRNIVHVGFGKIAHRADLPVAYLKYAHQFADYMNQGDNAQRLGLQRLAITNPYRAPAGSVVVVAAGSPGTHHPTAGDIAIADGRGRFINDGPHMGYGDPARFLQDGGRVLGVYVPS